MATELNAAGSFLVSKYSADNGAGGLVALVPGGLHEDSPPPGANTYPLGVFSLSIPHDVIVAGGTERLLTRNVYLVKIIAPGSGYRDSGVEAAAARLDDVLHDATGGTVQSCVRLRSFQHTHIINGVTYYERGGFYRLDIHGG